MLCVLYGLYGGACAESLVQVTPAETVTELEDGLSTVALGGRDFFDEFLSQGGADSDMGVAWFLAGHLLGAENLTIETRGFGCSTLSSATADGRLFGRNFDWYPCDAMVVLSRPESAYASISTVNIGFLGSVSGLLELLPQSVRTLAAHYAPLDGMNEKGLCVAVLMISDGMTIDQQTEKPDITTTTAVRLLLNQAASVDEAISLLNQYDLHASMGMMIHLAITDAAGKSVAVEYVDNEMVVTETPVVTNFYLAQGDRYGIGTQQSHTRFERLTDTLAAQPVMTMEQARDAMSSVSKRHFNDGETTEWTMVCDQQSGEARYYHRENYDTAYQFRLW